MKQMKSLTLNKKNQCSLTLQSNEQSKNRLHHSNPKPRLNNKQQSFIKNTYKLYQPSLREYKTNKNNLKLKTDIPSTLELYSFSNNSFAQIKNQSLANIIKKRQLVTRKDSYLKLKEKKEKYSLSIDISAKSSDQKSFINSTKYIPRKRSIIISKLKKQTQEQLFSLKQSKIFQKQNLPKRPKQILIKMGQQLHKKQIQQILQLQFIYFISKKRKSIIGQQNSGYDDSKGFYIIRVGDHILYRFEIIQRLGKGSFGQVIKVFDHKKKQCCALKIIRNRKTPNSQALIEYGILKSLNSNAAQSQNIVKVYQAFRFRNHFCMSFQLLSLNLYDVLKTQKFVSFSNQLIRRLAIQLLSVLIYLRRKKIVHCDIKPQNILLKQRDKSGIKLIDFGSSCYSDEKIYSYIQSRYYRAPQVILGYQYSFPIDMWSFGCVIAELKLTYPLFGGEDQNQQIGLIAQVIGIPDKSFYRKTQRGQLYFQKSIFKDRQNQTIFPNTRPLKDLFQDNDFVSFLKKILVWQPQKRIDPIQALKHPWILSGIPLELKTKHLNYLNEQQNIILRQTEKQQSSTMTQQISINNFK